MRCGRGIFMHTVLLDRSITIELRKDYIYCSIMVIEGKGDWGGRRVEAIEGQRIQHYGQDSGQGKGVQHYGQDSGLGKGGDNQL